ncbi:MAG TPA: D-glycero-beta-D-manno-heptose-7-phosphate kinase [Xanthobacteraceae bacterium]|jgi:D-beta-D-heptose 7-phosphate kinase/D-beta-D-heptose 1-phosphate adenosyltransferase|nr:D-glycero-beta-D-manno-heptose-7-phosphate kinase [Xanthobacteraceae bacterium]
MFDFDEALKALSAQTVLCVGDLMLDDFVYGEVTRISPEAPTPVLAVERSEIEIGGAGNVARNIAALGARCIFIGLTGKDDAARTLGDAFAKLKGAVEPHLVAEPGRHTTRKVRFVSEHHSAHLMRADWETAQPASAASEAEVIAKAEAVLPRVGAVVLSDYAKGVLTPRVIRAIIDKARKLGKPVVVDPKGHDYSIYRGATLITPNRQELGAAVHRPVTTEAEIAKAAADLAGIVDSDAVLVTRSEDGMLLHQSGREPIAIPAFAVKVRDVSGAGDTVAAVMAVLLAMQAPLDAAMRAANAAAAVVVGKRGTSTVSLAELRHRILPSASLAPEDKIVFDWSLLDDRLGDWRRHGLRIGFTNGCFDILHRGHVKLLAEARAACDRLVVGLNSDASTSRLKGPTRPINKADGRAEVLAALEAVDLVVVFEEDTPLELIKQVSPDILVKGADYTREQVVGREVVEANGGDVVLVGLVPGHSTTAIVERARPAKQAAGE